jgi:nucleoside-diphosphate-sugar epimerase
MATEQVLPKKILLFGATGVIGEYILQALKESKASFEKIGIFTSPGTVEKKKEEIDALKASGVDVIVGDVTNEDDVKKAYERKSGASPSPRSAQV